MKLTFREISKSYGSHQVLDHVSFEVQSGHPLGLLGRNGAGKTTLIRILMDILSKDGGEILLDGKPLSSQKVSFGYLPEEHGLYPKKKIFSQLCYIGMLKGLSQKDAKDQVNSLLSQVRLKQFANKNLDTLSKGNQQKIQLVATLLGDPKVVILDEPFSGLDPVNAQLLKDLVQQQAALGKVILFSSHQMSYVEEFCQEIAILHGGKIVLLGNLNDIKNQYPKNRLLIEADPSFATLAKGLNFVLNFEQKESAYILKLNEPTDAKRLLGKMLEAGIFPEKFEVIKPTLEEIFVEKAGDE